MLFDLRGRGRRRSVRIIYTGLALLMGVGLVGFGVGSVGSGGGLFTAATQNEGSNSASFASKIKKYEKLTKQKPSYAYGWEQLTKNLLHEAGGEAYTTSTGLVTSKGKVLYKRASQAWHGYLGVVGAKPNAELAQLMASVYGEGGLEEPAQAVQVLEYIVADRPTASFYYDLAAYAYKAKNTHVAELAAAKTVSLAPASERARYKANLEELKKNPSGEKTFTTTTNGKTYTGKLNSKGELKEAKEVPSKTASTATTTTSTTSTSKSAGATSTTSTTKKK